VSNEAPAGTAGEYAIGVDVGVTNIKAVCAAPDGNVLTRTQIDTVSTSPDWPARVKALVERLESERGPAKSVGVAAPGIAAPDGRSIWWMQGRLEEVQGLDWTKHLGRSTPVPVLNDAQAALLGEVWQGAARGASNAILLTLGTGVGGAALVDGRVLKGHLGRAGHLGHVSLDPNGELDVANAPGSLESAIGNCTVADRTGGRFTSTHDLIAAADAGDDEAKMWWLRSVRALAAALASLVNVLDPEVVVIGGGIARAGRSLFNPLAEYLDPYEWRPHARRVRIVPATLGEHAGALGAAWNALNRR
jgi:glucokinase